MNTKNEVQNSDFSLSHADLIASEDQALQRHRYHELNNVFTIIVSSADLMLLDLVDNNDAHEDLLHILAACKRGKEIVEQLRTDNRGEL
jgi:hypothetical protein